MMMRTINKILFVVVIVGLVGWGIYYVFFSDSWEPLSDYTLLDDIDGNLKKGFTVETIYEDNGEASKTKMTAMFTIDGIDGGTYTLTETTNDTWDVIEGYETTMDYLIMASLSMVDFTDVGETPYTTTVKTADGDAITYRTAGKPGSAFKGEVTVVVTGESTSSITGGFTFEHTITDASGGKTTFKNSIDVGDLDESLFKTKLSIKTETKMSMGQTEARETFTQMIETGYVKCPVTAIKAQGERSGEKFGNVECDRYRCSNDIDTGGVLYKSCDLYMYGDVPLKFTGKCISGGVESEASYKLMIYMI